MSESYKTECKIFHRGEKPSVCVVIVMIMFISVGGGGSGRGHSLSPGVFPDCNLETEREI